LSSAVQIGATADDVTALDPDDGPYALFLDIDGTLLELAARPDDVVIPTGLIDTLARVERALSGAVALVSGRPLAEVDQLFEPLRLRASGVHGAEIRFEPDGATASPPTVKVLPVPLVDELTRAAASFPGTLVEDKRFSLAIHYRLFPAAEFPLREAVERILARSGLAVEILDAHSAIEVKSPGSDKGGAIATFLSAPPFLYRKPVFIGDDTTDESGFALVSRRGGYGFSVGRKRRGAIGVFASPQAVREWLAEFAARGER
jgi:trehalose 6-phosphate phosphatase